MSTVTITNKAATETATVAVIGPINSEEFEAILPGGGLVWFAADQIIGPRNEDGDVPTFDQVFAAIECEPYS